MLFELGLGDQVVAVTHECDWPPEAAASPQLTRTVIPAGLSAAEIDRRCGRRSGSGAPLYDLDRERLAEVEPDLIVTQAVCEVCAVSYRRRRRGRCVASRPAPRRVTRSVRARRRAGRHRQARRRSGRRPRRPQRCARMPGRGWRRSRPRSRKPLARACSRSSGSILRYVAGHWVPDMISIAGGTSALGEPASAREPRPGRSSRAPRPERGGRHALRLRRRRSAEEARAFGDELASLGAERIVAVDASAYFSRPGPRLVTGVELLAHLLHPDRVPEPPIPDGAVELTSSSMRAEGLEPPRAEPTSS